MSELETEVRPLGDLIRELIALNPRNGKYNGEQVGYHEVYQKDFSAGFKDGKLNHQRKQGMSPGYHEGYNAGKLAREELGFRGNKGGNGKHKNKRYKRRNNYRR